MESMASGFTFDMVVFSGPLLYWGFYCLEKIYR